MAGAGRFFRPAVDRLEPYAPGRQPAPGARVVKLNTNENPYPPSPAAQAALAAVDVDGLRRYPDPMAASFQQAVADTLDVAPDWVLAGNGSDDLLTMLLRAVAGPGRAVAYPTPTYVLYRTLAAMQEAPVVEAPFDADYRLPVAPLIDAGAALTFVANPNSPSGTLAAIEDLDRLAAGLSGLLVIDEAYVAFAEGDGLGLVRAHDNVLVLRTLSKSHGLAGLRLGFAVGRPEVLAGLTKVKDSYNVDAVAMRVGAAALRDTAYTAEVVARIVATRTRLVDALEHRGFRVWSSHANFVLAHPADGDARRLHAGLEARGVLVRYFDEPGLDDCLRITVGTDDEQARLLDALSELQPPADGSA